MDIRTWNSFSRAEQLAAKSQIIPKWGDDDWLFNYIKTTWGVVLPREAHCPNCTAPFTVFADCFWARYHTVILRASRGTGKSVMLALLALTEQVLLNQYVMILGASEVQSKIVFNYLSQKTTRFPGQFWDHPGAPKALQEAKLEQVGRSTVITGGVIACSAASPTAIYGQRPLRLRMDETDLLAIDIVDSAMPCVAPFGGYDEQVLIASTSYKNDGTMNTLIERYEAVNRESSANGGEIVVPIYTFCYRDVLQCNNPDGYLTEAALKKMKQRVDSVTWERQYENGDPIDDECVFTPEELINLFDDDLLGHHNGEPIVMKGDPGRDNEVRILPKFWEKAGHYYHGADWGDRVDWTILTSFAISFDKNKPDVLFNFAKYGRWGLTKSVSEYDKILAIFEGSAAHDGNGNGQFVAETLENASESIRWTKNLKEEQLNKMIEAIKCGRLKFPRIKALEKAFKNLTQEHVIGKKHLPDEVASVAFAWYARSRVYTGEGGFTGGQW